MTDHSEVTKKVLTGVREILIDPDHWIQLANAHDANGFTVDARDPHATCFCLFGAAERVMDQLNIGYGYSLSVLERAIMREGFNSTGNIVDFNDESNRQHADIVKVLDTALVIADEWKRTT